MPRTRRLNGRSGARVIPERWNQDHAEVVSGAFNADVTITNPTAAPQIGDDLAYDAADPTPDYEGGARIQSWAGDSAPTIGDQQLQRSSYLVQIELAAIAIEAGAVVVVSRCEDPDLEDLTLTVENPVLGTERFTRDLFCVADRS